MALRYRSIGGIENLLVVTIVCYLLQSTVAETFSVSDQKSSSVRSVPAGYAPPGFVLTFEDTFTKLDTISSGPGPYTPGVNWYNGVDQCCMSPSVPGQDGIMYPTKVGGVSIDPYSLLPGGGLNISLTLHGSTWASGVMTTVDSSHKGFSQLYGYFEISTKLPPGPGTWPAFWMLPASTDTSSEGEIDIFEQYGKFQTSMCITLHNWHNQSDGSQKCFDTGKNLTSSYHAIGMLWEPTNMTFYLDGVQVWSTPTLVVMHSPYFMLVDLGIGGGWPSEDTPNPSSMFVQYVRAYRNSTTSSSSHNDKSVLF